jgi:hypothetical protein
MDLARADVDLARSAIACHGDVVAGAGDLDSRGRPRDIVERRTDNEPTRVACDPWPSRASDGSSDLEL